MLACLPLLLYPCLPASLSARPSLGAFEERGCWPTRTACCTHAVSSSLTLLYRPRCAVPQADLYDRLGGWDVLCAAVMDMYERLFSDPLTHRFFAATDKSKLMKHMVGVGGCGWRGAGLAVITQPTPSAVCLLPRAPLSPRCIVAFAFLPCLFWHPGPGPVFPGP